MQRLRADHAALFRAASQTEAASLLLECIRSGEPVVVMTGAPGLGKTTVLGQALEGLGEAGPVLVRLAPPFPAPLALQRQLAALLELPDPQGASPDDLAKALLLLPEPAPGMAPVAVVADAAEELPGPVLQYLWLMHSLTCMGRPALQLVLAGRDGLWRRLGEDTLAGLRRGISARLALQPLPPGEAAGLLQHALRQRGRTAEPDAAAEILQLAGGVPGRLLTVLDAACAGGPSRRAMTLTALRASFGKPAEAGKAPSPAARPVATEWLGRHRRVLPGAAAGALLLVAAGAWHFAVSDRSHRAAFPAVRPPASLAAPNQSAVPGGEARPVIHAAARDLPRPAVIPAAKAWLPHDPAGLAASVSRLLGGPDYRGDLTTTAVRDAGLAPAALFLKPTAPVVRAAVPMPPSSRAAAPPPPAVRVAMPPPPPPAAAAPTPKPPAAPMLVLADATAAHVVLLYARDDPAAASQASQAAALLRGAHIDAAPPEAIARPAERPGVGYFFLSDREAARAVAGALQPVLGTEGLRPLPMGSTPPPPGTVEVLFAGR